ncbi:ESF1 homolog isoform X2 [Halichondria panicea]|uniref:ESF1 homolog isoform X2 n=1 Tax=Halichondria panicea TaxID=6063 RepID=UPI00312B64E3
MSDPRFAHVTSDPRYKRVPRREAKVNIDARFQHMFSDKRFKVQYNVDKRGRKVNESSSEDLRKYYQLEVNEESDGEAPEEGETNEESDGEAPEGGEANEESDGEAPEEGSTNEESDGEAPEEGSTNEESDGEAPEEGETNETANEVIHDWGGVSEVVVDEKTSKRLAVCNMDWDRINANDIFALAHSFKPSEGSVCRVTVYPSQFGRERLSQEELIGPVSAGDDGVVSQESLRRYQLDRLRYYYGVIECESVHTAEAIYEQCDGLEYEHSGGQLDLRFIPDDMCFSDVEVESTATGSSMPHSFSPAVFVSKALQQSRVELTWDQTDSHRLQTTMRKFSKEDEAGMDFSAYLASDGEEDTSNGHKYQALLEKEIKGHDAAGGKVKGQPGGDQMEITWEPGLKESTTKLLKKKQRGDGLSRWEKYVQDKRKKKKDRKKEKETISSEVVGFDDDFFQKSTTTKTPSQGSRKRGAPALAPASAELDLLTMDDAQSGSNERGFDVMDPRFGALYESPMFAPDPAHPRYKHTEAMEAIMKEKMRRRIGRTDASVEPLVEAVKRKTNAFKKRRKMQPKQNTNSLT